MAQDLTAKYPLLQRAFDEQDGLFKFLESTTPEPLKDVQSRIAEVIENAVARPAAEKEALMVAAVIALAPPYLLDEASRFETDYSPEVQVVINEMLSAKPDTALPTNFAQVSAALGTVMMQDLTAAIKSGNLPASREEIAASLQAAAKDEPLVFQNLDSVGLKAAYDTAKTELATALKTPTPGPNIHPRKPGV